MKDLVDIVTYATNESFGLLQLGLAIQDECAKRGMAVPESFAAPEIWRDRFAAYAQKNRLPEEYAGFEEASSIASRFFDPALSKAVPANASWNPANTEWAS